jgi:hypothetical protein
MPLPLLAVAALVTLLVGASAAAVALWPAAKGKSLLLMGPEGSGKTTLRSFLTDGTIPKEHFSTAGMQKGVPKEDVKLGDLKLKIEAIWDPAGDGDAIRTWHEKAQQVDVLIYLVNLAEATDPAYVKRVRRDTGQLHLWSLGDELKAGSRTILVVTHLDRHEGFRGDVDSVSATEAARVARKAPAVRAACEELGPMYDLVAGSLRDEAGCADLAFRLLCALQDADA